MLEIVSLTNSLILTGSTSLGKYLAVNINDKNVGLPLFKFTHSTPNIDLIALNHTPELNLYDGTFYTNATSYGAGISIMINSSSFAIPLYKIPQNEEDVPAISFETPTIVSNLTSTGKYLLISIKEELYGIPLYTFNTEYPFITTLPQSAIEVKTKILVGKQVLDANDYQIGTTNLNNKIKAYSDLIYRIKKLLGWPTISLNICDEDIITAIDQAIELYTKYSGYTEEYLIFNSNLYKRGYGLRLDELFSITPEMYTTAYYDKLSACWDYDLKDYRKVISVWSFVQGQGTGINTLFTIEQVVANQVYFGNLLGQNGFDLITYDILKGWLDTREKVLAQRPYFRFDPKTQIFRLIPEPSPNETYYGVIGAYVERPIKHLINEQWVIYYSLALTKIIIGRIRGKYNFQLFGGGSINYNEILNEGIEEKKELERQLFTYQGLVEENPPLFFCG